MISKLAEWTVSGRLPALLIAAALGFLPLLSWGSAVAVALVTLRKGATEALWPLTGALLPASVAWSMGDMSFAGVLIASFVGAQVLASSRQLGWALSSIAIISVLMAWVMRFFPENIEQLMAHYALLLEELEKEGLALQQDAQRYVAMSLVWSSAWLGAITLLLARWLQARLFNPGGFQQEFHQLRLTPVWVGMLVGGIAVSQFWSAADGLMPVLVMPIILAALGLVHGVAALKQAGNAPLVMVYSLLALFAVAMVPLLMIAAITDSFSNYREKIAPPSA